MNIYLINLTLLIMTGFFVNQKRGFIKINIGNFPITLSKTVPFSVFWITILTLEYGLRGDFTTDYQGYKLWFDLAPGWNLKSILLSGNIEKLYLLLNKIIVTFTDKFYIFMLFIGLLTILFYFIALPKTTESEWVSLGIFFSLGFFYNGFNLCTQLLAGSIFALSTKFLFLKKPFAYILAVLIAASVHKSALIMLPLYFLTKIRVKSKSLSVIIWGIVAIGFLYKIDRIATGASTILYGNTYKDTLVNLNSGISLGYILKNILVLFLIFFFRKYFNMNEAKDKIIYLGCSLYGTIIIWSSKIELLNRFSYFLIIFVMLAVSRILEKYKGNKKVLKIVLCFMFIVMQAGWLKNNYYTIFR
nr:EpsG family protein [uncultured Blautia sp.]